MSVNSVSTTPIDRLIFEVADRLIRMLSHVQRVSRRLDHGDAGFTAARNVCALVEGVLLDFCKPLVTAARISVSDHLKAADAALEIRRQLQACHLTFLHLLPHPGQPVELRSFLRQVVAVASSDALRVDIIDSLFATERLVDQAFELDPSEAFSQRAQALNTYLAESHASETLNDWRLRTIAENGYTLDWAEGTTKFIAMPLIDLQNPCRWPSLTHEMGHHHAGETSGSLQDQFKSFIGEDAFDRTLREFAKWHRIENLDGARRTLGSWLLECYCDAFGAVLLGYSSWFSQLQAFFFTEGDYLFTQRATRPSYPPSFFRLRLLESLLKSRYEYVDSTLHSTVTEALRSEFALFKGIVGYVGSVEPWDSFDPLLGNLFYSFASFLRDKLKSYGEKTRDDIAFSRLEGLIVALEDGEPIPVRKDTPGHRRCGLAEILLAGWLNRNKFHVERICHQLRKAPTTDPIDTIRRAQAIVERFDESLKRSVQVAEWIDVLKDVPESEERNSVSSPPATEITDLSTVAAPCLLVDREIKALLRDGKLKIIPLINEAHQIGANSVDLRLGHNFEVFLPNVSGQLDLCAARESDSGEAESRYFEVDHLEGIVLNPGQFMLAHTLEYIRLPHSLAAQIDGRSSFARLGIQIHMTAGFVDAGFQGSLTLEIANVGSQAVKLYPGMRVAQLRFFNVSRPDKSYTELPNIKYRGLLSHNKTKQFRDPEVDLIRTSRSNRNESAKKGR